MQLAKAWIQCYKPDAYIHSNTRASNAPTSQIDHNAKRKRDSSQASNASQSSQSTVVSPGGEQLKNTTPTQDKDHKGQDVHTRGGSTSSTGSSSRSRAKLNHPAPDNPTFWQCLTCDKLNPTRHYYCSNCKDYINLTHPRFTSTPGPKGPRGGPRGRGYQNKK